MKKITAAILTITMLLTMGLTMFMPAYAADMTEAETKASALKSLGLFLGVSDTDFDLDRAPSRTEAIIMLIRVLGKEPEAKNGSWSHPFTDVASWADKYIGYAYEKGLSSGISATEFGTGNASSDMYLTFVLRALGYDDKSGDFAWNEPDTLAKSVGILTEDVDTADFLRADIVLVSWAALEANLKEVSDTGARTLVENLMSAGLFTAEGYRTAKLTVSGDDGQPAEEGAAVVSNFGEFQAAVENKEITEVNINNDIDITAEYFFERDTDLIINIEKGKTITVSGEFTPVGCTITNDGAIIVSGTFDRGLCTLINNGTVTVRNGGTAASGVSSTDNNGSFTVDAGANLLIERGSKFNNLGTLTNNGYISIKDGGNLDNEKGSLINNGTIDLYTYFNGDIKDITGTGTLKDYRE
ncbi:MAG: S-layer homology domain-containing protein [Clostridiaceae bacterium]|nr:S-layer homology domain-containing protein [Clostridiaceae bacterium]